MDCPVQNKLCILWRADENEKHPEFKHVLLCVSVSTNTEHVLTCDISLCISHVENESEASWQATSWALRGILVCNSTRTCSRDLCAGLWLFQGSVRKSLLRKHHGWTLHPSMKRLMEPGMWCELPALGCVISQLPHLMPVTPLAWDNCEEWDPFCCQHGSGWSLLSCCSGLSHMPAYRALRDCFSNGICCTKSKGSLSAPSQQARVLALKEPFFFLNGGGQLHFPERFCWETLWDSVTDFQGLLEMEHHALLPW